MDEGLNLGRKEGGGERDNEEILVNSLESSCVLDSGSTKTNSTPLSSLILEKPEDMDYGEWKLMFEKRMRRELARVKRFSEERRRAKKRLARNKVSQSQSTNLPAKDGSVEEKTKSEVPRVKKGI